MVDIEAPKFKGTITKSKDKVLQIMVMEHLAKGHIACHVGVHVES